jgi:hypothetical protein
LAGLLQAVIYPGAFLKIDIHVTARLVAIAHLLPRDVFDESPSAPDSDKLDR